jgi:hypothetical protein
VVSKVSAGTGDGPRGGVGAGVSDGVSDGAIATWAVVVR